MPRSVTLPDGSIFPNVPDNISDVDAVKEAVRRGYIEPPEGMLGTFGKNLVSSGLSGIAGLVATGEEALGRQPSETTRSLRKAAESWQAGPDLGEVAQRALQGDTSGIKYALPAIAGQAIPTLASFLIPGMGATKLAQLAKAGPTLSKLMQAGTALGVGTQAAEGQAILDRAEKGLPTDPAHTLPASIAQGGLDMLALNKILGLKGGVAPTSLLRRVGETAIGEAAVEPIQSMLGRYAELPAGTSPEDIAKYLTTPEAKKGYLGDILAGGLGGGMMGGVSHFGGQRSAEMAHVENLADRALARPRWEDTTSDEREAFAIYNSLNPKADAEVATEWARQRNDYKANQFTENADNVDFSGTATDLAEDKRDSINSAAEEMDAAEQGAQEAPQEIIDPMGMSDEELLSAFDNVDTRTQLTPYQRRRALDLHVRRQEAGRQQERRGYESYLLDTLRAVSQRMGAPTAEELTGVQPAGEMPLLSQEEADAQLKSSGISQLLNLLQQRRQQFAPSANTVIGAPSEESVTPLSAEEATNQQQMGSSLVQLRDVLRQVAQSKGPSAEQVLGTAPAKVDVMDAIQARAASMNQRPALPPGTGAIPMGPPEDVILGRQVGQPLGSTATEDDLAARQSLYSTAPEATAIKMLPPGTGTINLPDELAALGRQVGQQPGSAATEGDLAARQSLYPAAPEVDVDSVIITPELANTFSVPKSTPFMKQALKGSKSLAELSEAFNKLKPEHQASVRSAIANFPVASSAPAQTIAQAPGVSPVVQENVVPSQPPINEVPDASQIQSAVAVDASRSTQPIDSQVLGGVQESGAGVPPVVTEGQEVAGKGVETPVGVSEVSKPTVAVDLSNWKTVLKEPEPFVGFHGDVLRKVAEKSKDPVVLNEVLDSIPINTAAATSIANSVALNKAATDEVRAKAQHVRDNWVAGKGVETSVGVKYARSQKQTETPEFKRWFGDSKVVDDKGKPLVVYHWTDNDFTVFDMNMSGEGAHFGTKKAATDRARGMADIGYEIEEEEDGQYFVIADSGPKADEWQGPFTTKKEAISFRAQQPKKIEPLALYLSIKNPIRLPDLGTWSAWDIVRALPSGTLSSAEKSAIMDADNRYEKLHKTLLDKGVDGIVYRNEVEDKGKDSYIVFDPTQIKSVTGNIGTFDPNNPDIRYATGKSSGTKQTAKTLEAHARKAFGKHTARLMDMGRINIVNSIKDLPGSGHPEDTQALTMPDGSTYYVADQIDPSEIKGLILHEVGAHVGLKSMMGEEAFNNLLKQASGLQGDAAKAARQAAASYPINEQAEEMLAYLVQNAPQTGIVRRIISSVKNWLNKTFPGLVSLNEADIRSLAEAAIRHVAEFSPTVQSRNQPALAKKVVKTAMDRIEEKRIDVPAAVGRVMSKMTSLDQVLDNSPLKKEVSNQLLDPMRRISGMQGLLKKEANTLENRVKKAISRRPEVNAMLGDLTNLATIVNHDPSTGPMSEQAKKELLAGLDEEAANKMLADVATLEKMWKDVGARPDGRELHAIFKETREWYQKSLDKFDKAMRARFAKDPNMLDVYKKFYESAKRKVYFPLSRFGDFSVSFENADGDLEYYRFDTQSEMESFVRQVAPRAKQGTLDYGKSIDDIRHLSDDEQARKALADTLAKLAKSPRMKAQAELQALTSRLNENDDISQTSLDDLIKAAKKDGVDSPTLRKLIRSVDRFSRQRDAAEVQKLLDALPTAEKEIRNYLQGIMMAQMPSRSLLKHMMHRKGTLGYTNDFARALSAYNFKLANQLPRLQYRTAINEGKRTVEKALKAAAGIGVDEQGHALKPVITPDTARDITIRINEEVDGVLSPPTISPVVSTITTWAYRKYMATPAAAVFQTSSLPLLSLPMLGSRYGLAKTQGALNFASSLFWDGFSVLGKEVTMDMPKAIKRAHLPPRKRAELLDAWQKMEESGVVAHGEIQQALGGGKSPTSSVLNPSPVQKKASEALRWIDGLFSAGDAAPRHVTALAAYQLARDAGKSHEDAIRDAIDQTYEALGDYSDVGRPAITRGNIGRILYQFQSYSQKMMSTLFRLYSEWRGANLSHLSPKEQKEVSRRALRSMTGILASHALLAGSLGLPFAATLMGLTDLLRDWDDEDEYHDAEIDMRRFMKNELGMTEFMTRAFMEGLPGALLDMKVSTRIGAGELPLRLEFEKKTAEENMKENFFKTFGGTAGSFATDIGKAVDYLNRGDYGRAFETLTPVALSRAAASAYRMASEGVKTRQGGVLVSPEEMSMVGLIGQALGVSNLSAYEMRQEKFYLKRAEVFINDRKKELYNAYNTALETGDQQKINEVLEEIARFNKHYTDPKTGKGLITPESLKKSVDNHKKFLNTNGALGLGININPKILPFIAGPRELEELVSANR